MVKASGSVVGYRDGKQVTFYGLSTCVWCKRTRRLLEDLEVPFDYFYVDLLKGKEREEVIERVREWNSSVSFPTVVVDEEHSVIGYKPDEIKEALGL